MHNWLFYLRVNVLLEYNDLLRAHNSVPPALIDELRSYNLLKQPRVVARAGW